MLISAKRGDIKAIKFLSEEKQKPKWIRKNNSKKNRDCTGTYKEKWWKLTEQKD